jgi:soluble lytic murein transglycosylase-like protein
MTNKCKITILTGLIAISLLGSRIYFLNSDIALKEEIIEKVEIENNNLYEQLAIANGKVGKYESVMNAFKNIEIKKEDYIYYDIEKLNKSQQEYIQNLCKQFNFSFELVLGIMHSESRFDIDAISYDGSSSGIMQIKYQYADYYANLIGLKDYNLYNFKDNVMLGFSNLIHSRQHFIDLGYTDQESLTYLILGAYNRGIGGMTKYHRENGTIVTKYSKDVLKYKMELEQQIN